MTLLALLNPGLVAMAAGCVAHLLILLSSDFSVKVARHSLRCGRLWKRAGGAVPLRSFRKEFDRHGQKLLIAEVAEKGG